MMDAILNMFTRRPPKPIEPKRRLSIGEFTGGNGESLEVVRWLMPDGREAAATYDALTKASGVMFLERLGGGRVKITGHTGPIETNAKEQENENI